MEHGCGGKLVSRTLVFSSQIYSIETIKKAVYRFSDVLSVDIIPRFGEIECIFHFLSGPKEEEQAQKIMAAFRNEVLRPGSEIGHRERNRSNPQRRLGFRAFQDRASRR